MAIRQYIGARYVPRFMGLYNTTTIYEALDVVDNGQGTSYIARKTVPANTPLSDTNYWFVYGATSGAILSLQTRVDALENNRQYNNSNRRFILIGDSLGTGDFAGAGIGWCDYYKTAMGLVENDNVFTTAISGRGFTGGSGYLAMAQALTVTQPETITDIIVLGGLNDHSQSYATILAAATGLYNYLHTEYPNAEIYFGAIGRSAWNGQVNLNMLNNVVPALKDSPANYISGIENFGHEYYNYMDTWHWSEVYTEKFAKILANNLDFFPVAISSKSTTFTPDAQFSSSGNPFPYMWQTDDIIFATGSNANFQFNTDIAWGGTNEMVVTLGVYDACLIEGLGQYNIPFHGFAGFTGPTTYHQIAGEFSFNPNGNGKTTLKARFTCVFDGDTGYVNRTLHQFWIRSMGFNLPSLIC